MATFESIKRSVLALMSEVVVGDSDPLEGNQVPAGLLLDAAKASLTAICQRAPRQAVASIGGGLTEYDLPSDFIEVEGVKDLNTGLFLNRMKLAADIVSRTGGITWTEFPFGKLVFSEATPSEGLTLYYAALWKSPEELDSYDPDSAVLELPKHLLTPMILYMTSYCAAKRFSETAETRQYATKVDSGDPLDNPFEALSNFFLKRFETEMSRLSQRQRGSY